MESDANKIEDDKAALENETNESEKQRFQQKCNSSAMTVK